MTNGAKDMSSMCGNAGLDNITFQNLLGKIPQTAGPVSVFHTVGLCFHDSFIHPRSNLVTSWLQANLWPCNLIF